MARFIARPVIVDAFKIVKMTPGPPAIAGDDFVPGRDSLNITLENGSEMVATPAMTARFMPAIGDYWVIQPDGYVYLNPAAVFTSKYWSREERERAVKEFLDASMENGVKKFEEYLRGRPVISDCMTVREFRQRQSTMEATASTPANKVACGGFSPATGAAAEAQ